MRLKSISINQYKNLKDFKLSFDGDSFIDVFVGKNGSGKSNLFEALVEIFRHVYEYDKEKGDPGFSYTIKYEISGTEIEIGWEPGKLTINGSSRKTIGQLLMPDNVLIYYSGHNDTVETLMQRYEETFRKRIKSANLDESRRFIGIGPEYKQLLLAVLLMQKTENKARQFICHKLGIAAVASGVRLVLKRPFFADGKLKLLNAAGVENFDSRTHYWGADGITRQFLDKLMSCVKGEFNHDDLYSDRADRYQIPISTELFQQVFKDEAVTDIFRQFDNLKILGMLEEISISLTLTGGLDATIAHFSDGQLQSVYIYSIIELFKDRNCLTLLDEPDSFLHPEWQFDFLKQVFEITDTAAKNNHVLMSSHSASTLCSLEDQNINLFKMENSTVFCSKRSKKEMIHELSGSFIQYSEDESRLLIDNVIRSSLRPILFVEGPTDVSILNTAYKKLYPDKDISVLIQDAFDRGFIRILFSRHEVFATYPDKEFFALFDFDDAYDDWRDLGGEHKVTDIELGLCRKLSGKNAHAFLLPIPNNQLKAQVWDENNQLEKIKPKRHFCMEHIFWDIPGLDQWFRTDDETGFIKFKGNKVKFAKEIIPNLNTSCFEILRPMFEFIRSKSS
jgi:energy-coupling factor transporter ATP-binding protein EcfA2